MRLSLRIHQFEQRISPEPNTGCWLWTGFTKPTGYGTTLFVRKGFPREQLAHRVSYILHKGEIPRGHHVLHRCDTPSCVNPDHLFIGTHLDNMQDKKTKGRVPRKISDQDAALIIKDPRTQAEIAKAYGVSRSAIASIKQGRRRLSV